MVTSLYFLTLVTVLVILVIAATVQSVKKAQAKRRQGDDQQL